MRTAYQHDVVTSARWLASFALVALAPACSDFRSSGSSGDGTGTSSGGTTSGSSTSTSGGGGATSTSSSASSGGSTSGSTGGTSTSSTSSGSTGAPSMSCEATDPDFCGCTAGLGASNAASCGPSTLKEPGACCAPHDWPTSGTCTCASFVCDVNAGGGYDCWYHSGNAVHATSATGAACCVRQGICSCYDASNVDSCKGYPSVGACTQSALAPCTDPITSDEHVVPSCR